MKKKLHEARSRDRFRGGGAHLADNVLVELVGVLAHDCVVDIVVKRCPDLTHATTVICDAYKNQADVRAPQVLFKRTRGKITMSKDERCHRRSHPETCHGNQHLRG